MGGEVLLYMDSRLGYATLLPYLSHLYLPDPARAVPSPTSPLHLL